MSNWNLIENNEPENGRYIFYIKDRDKHLYSKGVSVHPDYDDVFVGRYMGNGYVDDEPDGPWPLVWAWFYAPDFSAIFGKTTPV
jgi:hypothetical protein